MSATTYAWLVLAFPLAGCLVNAFGWRVLGGRTAGWIGTGAIALAFVNAIAALVALLGEPDSGRELTSSLWTYAAAGGLEIKLGILVDPLSGFMILVVSGVSALIHLYSVAYLASDRGYARYFSYLNFFVFSMLLLVLAGNFVLLIVGWAFVGFASYALISFWYRRNTATRAGMKAFVINVIGDVAMVFAAFLIFRKIGSFDYGTVFSAAPDAWSVNEWEIIAVCLLLLVGAFAKSAQLPLHTWLPDAMEGPTPVSALIHAATMVTAGVYLIGRFHPIYNVAVFSHNTAAAIGTISALVAATIAIVQTDIKRVLAYSTMSQIGYMFLAVGVGAYAAGFFHLLAHAFFKALLFMAAGNVIHAMHDEQDMRRFGGLWNQMRGTAVCFLIGSLSLVGIIPFVGFWSKELVLGDTFSKGGAFPLSLWAIGFVTALLTGFYTGRMWWLSFTGRPSPERPVEHPHEAPSVMFVPVVILAVLTTIGGFIQINAGFHGGWELVSDFLAPTVGTLPWEERTLDYIPTAATLLLGTVRGVGTAVEDTAGGLSLIQNGFFRSYMVVFVVGAVVAFIVVLVRV